MRRELDSRFLQSSIGTSSSTPSSTSNQLNNSIGANMPPPPLQFNSIHSGLPPTRNNNDILHHHIEKMASSTKSSTLPNLNEHHQNLLMNQFFRNGVINFFNNNQFL